jgi:hypothetical protein
MADRLGNSPVTTRLYLDGKEVDPAEYSFAPGGPMPGGLVTFRKPLPPGSFTLSFESDEPWKYGDLLDFNQIGSPTGEVVMYVGRSRGDVHSVLDLMNGVRLEALAEELATIEPPSMLARPATVTA